MILLIRCAKLRGSREIKKILTLLTAVVHIGVDIEYYPNLRGVLRG
jgi:hypothetical protein